MDLAEARAVLLEHARHPRNLEGVRPTDVNRGAAVDVRLRTGECRNPICGDHVRISVQLSDNRITDIGLQVQGCTICTASASLMSDLVKDRTETEVAELRTAFQTAIGQPPTREWPDTLTDLAALKHLRVNPARIPCSLIGWFALKDALKS